MDQNSIERMNMRKWLMEEPYREDKGQVVIMSDDEGTPFFKLVVSPANDELADQIESVAKEIKRTWNAEKPAVTGHYPGSRVKVLCQDGWMPGTVHKEIRDNKLTGHDHGDVITTTTWVVWLDEQKWWRSDMAEHIRNG